MLRDRRTDRQKVITIAHPEHSSGELKGGVCRGINHFFLISALKHILKVLIRTTSMTQSESMVFIHDILFKILFNKKNA